MVALTENGSNCMITSSVDKVNKNQLLKPGLTAIQLILKPYELKSYDIKPYELEPDEPYEFELFAICMYDTVNQTNKAIDIKISLQTIRVWDLESIHEKIHVIDR